MASSSVTVHLLEGDCRRWVLLVEPDEDPDLRQGGQASGHSISEAASVQASVQECTGQAGVRHVAGSWLQARRRRRSHAATAPGPQASTMRHRIPHPAPSLHCTHLEQGVEEDGDRCHKDLDQLVL